jgi:hypothetical protein
MSGTLSEARAKLPTSLGDDDHDAAGGKGEKKKKDTYKYLIKGIPGVFLFLLS